jgi:HPt (histidine-containing phosphotransfer) domain-containing protein
MELENLEATKAQIEQQFKNLSDPQWVASQLSNLRGKFDILTEVINALKEKQDAKNNAKPATNSNNDKRK